ncbi:hypothetical protein [uncultured Legionella sp.]|uniref:hypothetical protein n=1 Tax=uncultured Legionella sp. TaxID=210934 RepID=UPI00260ACDE0|nr:hypothetical protein [uncultured Legionella sp.]
MMKKISKIALSALFLWSALQSFCYASELNGQRIARQCLNISHHLLSLARSNPDSYCVGDIEGVAQSLELTGKQFELEKPERILTAIKYAELELQAIKNNRTYCSQFHSLINPVIKEIKTTGHEVEIFVSNYLIT